MIGPVPESVKFAPPSAPGNAATVVLFSSVSAFGPKMMRMLGLDMVELVLLALDQASAANGLKAYGSDDGGTTWYQMSFPSSAGTATMPVTLAALAAGSNHQQMFEVAGLNDFKLEFTAGATGPTAGTGWVPVVTGHLHARSVTK